MKHGLAPVFFALHLLQEQKLKNRLKKIENDRNSIPINYGERERRKMREQTHANTHGQVVVARAARP